MDPELGCPDSRPAKTIYELRYLMNARAQSSEKLSSTLGHEIWDAFSSGEVRITLGSMAKHLGPRSFGVLLAALALPVCVPSPPGVTSVMGLPIMLLAIQMAFGRSHVVLPSFLSGLSVSQEAAFALLKRADRALVRLEAVLRPERLARSLSPLAVRALGLLACLFGFIVAVPLPLTSWMPAIGLLLLAIGLVRRDGLVILAGVFIGMVGSIIALMVMRGLFLVVLL